MNGLQIDTVPASRLSAAARLDRLPIGSFHKQIVWLIAYVFFFELGDLNTFAFAAPAIRVTWNLSISTIGYITSAAFFGMFLGSLIGGRLSDRLGRKRALIFSTAFYSGFSLLNAFVWNIAGLLITRFLTGAGLAAMTVVGITYISEMFPAKQRGAYQGWILTVGLFGIPVTAYLATWLISLGPWGWRLVFVWGSLGVLLLFVSHLLEESPRWYENHGRLDEADAVLERIEARVRKEFGELPPVPEVVAATPRSGKFSELFSSSLRGRTSMLIMMWIFEIVAFYGFVAWVPTLLAARGISIVKSLTWTAAMHVGAPIGALIGALVAERWERKWSLAVMAIVIAACGLMYGLSSKTLAVIIFGFLMSMLIQAFTVLWYTYTAECFPTNVRNSGTGLAYGAGRLANVFGPLVIAFVFIHYGYVSVFVYIATLWVLVGMIAGVFGPKTKGRTLV
jgi:MFS transporter, putative metabolite:H+ symporter